MVITRNSECSADFGEACRMTRDKRFLCRGGNCQIFQIFVLSNGNNHDVFVYIFINNFVFFSVIMHHQKQTVAPHCFQGNPNQCFCHRANTTWYYLAYLLFLACLPFLLFFHFCLFCPC
jgi:hypothetical protein